MSDKPRILIVESNDVLRAMLFTILRYQPVGVDTAATAEDALEKITRCDYALAVVDVDMPDNAGERFLRDFRKQRPEATTFVIAVRYPDNETYLDPQIVSAVLNKPLEIDTLAEVVRECSIVVPLPEDPVRCPPAESEVRSRMDHSSHIPN